MSWVAYVDESVRVEASVYVLAAAVLEAEQAGSVREEVRSWHLELDVGSIGTINSRRGRDKAVGLVAPLAALQVVVVGTALDPRRQERARRLGLARLLYEVQAAGVAQAWLEARSPSLKGTPGEACAWVTTTP